MPIDYLIDEHIRSWLGDMLAREGVRRGNPIHFLDVGDHDAPSLGSTDPELLAWAAENGYVLVSMDKKTMSTHFANLLVAGNHSAGVFLVRRKTPLSVAIDFLMYAAIESSEGEWADSITYV